MTLLEEAIAELRRLPEPLQDATAGAILHRLADQAQEEDEALTEVLASHFPAAGAAEGTRTPDPRITNAMLYQLSYRGARH